MNLPVSPIRERLQQLRERYEHRNDPPPTIVPPLNEDLSDMTLAEVRNELAAVKDRLDMGKTQPSILQPEGESGLRYRLARLQAQEALLKRKKGTA